MGIEVQTMEKDQQHDELKLLKRAMKTKEGLIVNPITWGIFYNRYYKFVKTVANYVLHDEDEAEDMTDEVLIKISDHFSKYNGQKPFKPWLGAVTRNYCINKIKERSTKPTHYVGSISADEPFDDENDYVYYNAEDLKTKTPLENAILQEQSKNLNTVVNQMKQDFRDIICMKYFEGMSYEAIAKEINKPVGTVMSRLFNARKKMQELYNKLMSKN